MTRIEDNKIEELAELISDKLIEDLEERFNINLLPLNSGIATSIEENGIPKIKIAADINYLAWKIQDGKYKLEVINEDLGCFYKDTLCYADEEVYKKFLIKLQDDILITTLAEALLDLLNKISKVKSKNLQGLFFTNLDDIQSTLQALLAKLGSENNSKILDLLHEESEYVTKRLPIDTMPLAAYILSNNKKISKKLFDNILCKSNNIGVKWITSVYPDSQKEKASYNVEIKESLLSYEDFIGVLNRDSEKNYNKSLNLYLFNQLTKLHDFEIISRSIFKNSLEMRVIKTYFTNKKYEALDKEIRFKLKEKLCKKVTRLTNLKGLISKKFIIENHLNKDGICKNKFINQFNSFYDMGVVGLRKAILENEIGKEKYIKIDEKIKNDFIVYDVMIQESPYDKYIKNISEKIELIELPTNSIKKTMKYEIYYYTYKSIYKYKIRA